MSNLTKQTTVVLSEREIHVAIQALEATKRGLAGSENESDRLFVAELIALRNKLRAA